MTIAAPPKMTLQEYLVHDDGTDARYELVHGVLVEMGAENPLNSAIATFLLITFFQLGIPYSQLAIGHQIEVNSSNATARQPDLIVHSAASRAAIFEDGKLLRVGQPVPLLVVEVVSNSRKDQISRDRDYQEKAAEYAARCIPEYWIIDPDEAIVKVGLLSQGVYQFQDFAQQQAIASLAFPTLSLSAQQVLSAGA
jgi:Uma2 family endonuclease